jgi:hypothetical protein
VHLTVDFVASAFLALAPFLFGYSNEGVNVWLPQVIAGVAGRYASRVGFADAAAIRSKRVHRMISSNPQ